MDPVRCQSPRLRLCRWISLKFLEGSLEVKGYGIEKDDAHWLNTLKYGLNVIQMDLESGLSGFESQSFDVVVLSQTLQAIHNIEKLRMKCYVLEKK